MMLPAIAPRGVAESEQKQQSQGKVIDGLF
jgi:hypothetical protein